MAFGPCPVPTDPFHPGHSECTRDSQQQHLLSGAVFLCTPRVTGPGLVQNWWAVHKCHTRHIRRANLLLLGEDGTAPPAQGSASKDEQKTGVSSISWILKVLVSCPWHTSLYRYFMGGCVWNNGFDEGTSSSATGEGRQGMAIPWDQKKVNSLVSNKGWPLQSE